MREKSAYSILFCEFKVIKTYLWFISRSWSEVRTSNKVYIISKTNSRVGIAEKYKIIASYIVSVYIVLYYLNPNCLPPAATAKILHEEIIGHQCTNVTSYQLLVILVTSYYSY